MLKNLYEKGLTYHSFIFGFYSDTKELIELLDISVSQTDEELIKKIQKESNAYKKAPNKIKKNRDLKEFFQKDMTKSKRNENIIKAHKECFTQNEGVLEIPCQSGRIIQRIDNEQRCRI